MLKFIKAQNNKSVEKRQNKLFVIERKKDQNILNAFLISKAMFICLNELKKPSIVFAIHFSHRLVTKADIFFFYAQI